MYWRSFNAYTVMFLLSLFALVTLSPLSANAHFLVECTEKPGNSRDTTCKDVSHKHSADATVVESGTESTISSVPMCPNDPCLYISIPQGCTCICGVVTCPNDAIVKPMVPETR